MTTQIEHSILLYNSNKEASKLDSPMRNSVSGQESGSIHDGCEKILTIYLGLTRCCVCICLIFLMFPDAYSSKALLSMLVVKGLQRSNQIVNGTYRSQPLPNNLYLSSCSFLGLIHVAYRKMLKLLQERENMILLNIHLLFLFCVWGGSAGYQTQSLYMQSKFSNTKLHLLVINYLLKEQFVLLIITLIFIIFNWDRGLIDVGVSFDFNVRGKISILK